MIRQRRLVAFVAAIALLFAGCAQRLGDRLGEAVGTPVDVNDVGTILSVKYDGTRAHGLLLSGVNGNLTRINGPSGAGFIPFAINDLGVVVGATVTTNGREARSRAVSWTPTQGFLTFDLPPGTFQSWATDINDRGEILMNAFSPSGSPGDGAYLISGVGSRVRLTDPPGASNGRPSVAEAINDAGTIVGGSGNGSAAGGERAVEWAAGTRAPRLLGALGVVSRALDINARGTAVGSSTTTPGEKTHAIAWLGDGTASGPPTDLGPGSAKAVNDADFLVGQDAATTPARAAAWSARTRVKILLGALKANSGSTATAINNRNFAVGDSDGESTYYPVPEF
jgi:uncharacterized membrane protein